LRHAFSSKRRGLWYQNITDTFGYKNVKECYVKSNPLVPLQWNETSNRFEVVRVSDREAKSGGGRRRGNRRLLSPVNRTDNDIVYGRLCHCASELSASTPAASSPHYCPDSVPVCTAFYDRSAQPPLTVTCSNTTNTLFARYLFPLSFFLVFFYAFLCACSPKGLAARMHVKNKRLRWLSRLRRRRRRQEGARQAGDGDEARQRDDDEQEALVGDDLDWLLHRQQARHRLAVEVARQEGTNRRLFIPGSTPVSALLLELSARQHHQQQQQQQQQQQESPQEARPPPTPGSDPALIELATISAGAVSPADGGQSSQPPLPSAQPSRPPAVFFLKTRVYDPPETSTIVRATRQDRSNPTGLDASGADAFDAAADVERSGRNVPGEEGLEGEADACTCSICLVDLARGDRVGGIPCGHAFHTACIKDWVQRRHRLCPLCKAEIPLVTPLQRQNWRCPASRASSASVEISDRFGQLGRREADC
jgi:hypothetical protein